jgi:phosphoribosylformimino-5-aminoimidazole carboxamide ribotide isomerase
VAAVILFPAIDVKDGQCVRLRRGNMAQATVYNADPTAQAKAFEATGFSWLHIVDLDGAFAGTPRNAEAIDAILKSVTVPIQLGGGIRSLERIEYWLSRGIRRVILGTAALRDPQLVRHACRNFPEQIVVGIDARDGKVAVEGWAQTAETTAIELASRFGDCGVAALIFTDIDRDGVLTGINIESTLALAQTVDIPVIASGGLASLDDIRRLLEPRCRILEGVISGRALYDGRIDSGEALRIIRMAAVA